MAWHPGWLREMLRIDWLIAPPECLICRASLADTASWCPQCREELLADYYHCQRCAMPLNEVLPNLDCVRCRGQRWKFERVIALGPYADRLRNVVIASKRPHQELLRRALAKELAQRVADRCPGARFDGVIAVPNHWTHRLTGGGDVAGDLARWLARELGLPLWRGTVHRTRNTAKQGMLTWGERRDNVRGAFQATRVSVLSEKNVILVDDVMTSGATLAEVAGVLVRAGCRRVIAAVIARGTGTRSTPSQRVDTIVRTSENRHGT
ncbi:MAG: phosphoribosyltransferase [Pirellulaceae bacterium]|nr:MAG: phosphoribosyltransferase [Pirellulaceae bacterium]